MIDESSRQQFLEQGYLVIPEVIPEDLCRRVVDAILAFTGVRPDEPSSWQTARFAGLGIVPLHHHQALWDVRQHLRLYEAFRDLYQTQALWVTMDRVGYKPPDTSAKRAPVHWDCDAWSFEGLGIQGLVYLTDTSVDQGAFCCVPSIYRDLRSWLDAHESDDDRRHPLVDEADIVPVAGGTGSLVVFHRLMPHTNGCNTSARPRFAQYVTMNPAGSDVERADRIDQWRDNMPPAWALRQKVDGQQIPEPGGPARLSELGRKLVGLDRW